MSRSIFVTFAVDFMSRLFEDQFPFESCELFITLRTLLWPQKSFTMGWRKVWTLITILILGQFCDFSQEKVIERSGWSSSSYTFVDVNHKWTIGTISFLHHSVSSDPFSASGTTMEAVKWKLHISKQVSYASEKTCIQIEAFEYGSLTQVTASYTLNITDNNGNLLLSAQEISSHVFKKQDYPPGPYCNRDLHSSITQRRLLGDTIIIKAFIRMGESISVVNSQNPIRYIDVPVCDFNEEAKAVTKTDLEYSNTYFVLDSGETAPAPRTLLASKSAEFDRIFKTVVKPLPKSTKVALPDMDLPTLRIITSFAYSGENLTSQIPGGSGLEKKLLAAAHKYGLKKLKMGIQNVLGHQVTKDNALDMLDLAEKYEAYHLKEFIVDFIRKNALNMTGSEWKLLVDQMTMKQCQTISNTTCL